MRVKIRDKRFQGGIEKINSKLSWDENHNQELNIKNYFSEQQNSFLNQKLYQNRIFLTTSFTFNQIN